MTTSDAAVTRSVARGRLRRFIGSWGWQLRIGIPAVVVLALAAVLAPFLTPYDPTQTAAAIALHGPSPTHLFGTDQLGRDIFSRVLYGARIDLLIGTVGVAIPLVAGSLIGLVSGFATPSGNSSTSASTAGAARSTTNHRSWSSWQRGTAAESRTAARPMERHKAGG